MINIFHAYSPEPILISLGPINIYWYGVFIILGILAAVLISLKLAEYYHISKSMLIDTVFYLLISGIIGARLYHIFLELPYYIAHPLNILKIWQGGLAIHGGVIVGLAALWLIARKNNFNFWLLAAIFAPAISIAQAIGRWGNYFNQELFGRPTGLPWGIPILPDNRIADYYNFQFFHPAFLYESLGNFFIFLILIFIHIFILKKIASNEARISGYKLCLLSYAILYSLLRFSLEYIRIDITPVFWGLRFPQIVSLIIIFLSLPYFKKQISAIKNLHNQEV